jgi:ribosomal-protein-alanine N-acetyltransferase
MTVPTLRTERLLLRPFARSDVPDLTLLAGAREVAANTLRIPYPYTKADAEMFITASSRKAHEQLAMIFAIEVPQEHRLVGAVGLELEMTHRRAELGYWIGVPYWGNGYATESAGKVVRYGFDVLNLNRIHAGHFPHNPASGKVLKKIGMKYEGCLRSHIRKWDQIHDLEIYGLLRSDLSAS